MTLISSRDLVGPVSVNFLTRLLVELHDTDRRLRMTLMGYLHVHVIVPRFRIDQYLTVPAGFQTDLASIPRALWWIPGLSPVGRIERSAALHDWLYDKDCPATWCTRAMADAILEAGMRADGESWLVRELVWAGVRLGGQSHWRKAA